MGGARTLNFSNAGSIKAYDREEAQRYGGTTSSINGDMRKTTLLKTGTEHWKTNYQQMSERANSTNKLNGNI